MCDSPSDTRALVHIRAASVPRLNGARAADIKTPLMFLSGNLQIFSDIITHVGTNDVCLSANMRCGIIYMFHKALKKKCEQSIFSAVSKWESRFIGSRFFFGNRRLLSCRSNKKLNFQDRKRHTPAHHHRRAQVNTYYHSYTT